MPQAIGLLILGAIFPAGVTGFGTVTGISVFGITIGAATIGGGVIAGARVGGMREYP